MRISLKIPPGVKVKTYEDDDGEIVEIDFVPHFHSSRAVPAWAYGTSATDGGEVCDQFLLVASGSNANVTLRKRNQAAKALIDMTPEERAKAGARDESDDSDAPAS